MFQSTLPFGEPELMRASEFQRYLDSMLMRVEDGDPVATRLPDLSPSLLQDLVRFERNHGGTEVLEVLAASLRHAQALTVHLQWQDRVVPLTVFPAERLVHCPLPMDQFMAGRLAELQVMQVERAMLRPPGDPESALVGEHGCYAPLAPLLWAISMRGARDTVLPEIGGVAAYRVAPGARVEGLEGVDMGGALSAAVERLRRQTTSLRELAEWPAMDRVRAARLLNALYLMAGLIVSRTHPAATNDGWFGYR
jgi:hypothetical protein